MSTNAHSDCERIAQDLPAYLYSDLSDAERDAVESHISACRTCAAEEAGFREVK
ncbi:zf-HC2 domain-containing protein, partial [bacterium]|nr:zf-HC2 domain-containing protein [bacterium]